MKFEFTPPKNQKIEIDELIKELVSVAEKLGKSPTMAEYNSMGKYEVSVFCRRFGSWNTALLKANLAVNNKEWTEIELYSNIENVWIYLGKQPTRRDMDKEYSKISSGAYKRHFYTWTNALKSFVTYINDSENDNETIEKNSAQEFSHKTSRDINLRLRFLVMKRDNFKCCVCGRSPATAQGLELQVDHIKPWTKGGETTLENLQTLCRDCNLGKSDLE
ncbi:MAG: HNH endonuclease [Clostridia bacterium]|nr:HNH endonuclease [Clostridia bacterium]